MKIITNEAAQSVIDTISRPRQAADVRERVSEIISRVRTQGDEAICEYSRMFDDIDMGSTPRIMNREELELYVESNKSALTDIQIEAIDEAVRNVTFVAQKSTPQSWEEKAPAGQVIGERFIPMTRVACYVPQGSFPLVSTAIHTAAIAQACGVQEIVMVTSPSNDDLNVAVAYAALASGVTEIVFAGGAQGIAAVAYGTETISRVDFICGPGNQYVAEAKRQVFGDVGIDMVAGPSEVFVIADDNADAYAIACDLVAQAEHGSGSETSVLLSTSRDVIDGVARELENLKPQILNNAGFDKVFDESPLFGTCRKLLKMRRQLQTRALQSTSRSWSRVHEKLQSKSLTQVQSSLATSAQNHSEILLLVPVTSFRQMDPPAFRVDCPPHPFFVEHRSLISTKNPMLTSPLWRLRWQRWKD
jgi:histidinol dehydrogenase